MPTESTRLSPLEAALFAKWVEENKNAPGVGTYDSPEAKYDMTGFFHDKQALSQWKPGDHFPDTYKTHGHPTFSIQSKYSKGPFDGGTWDGDQFVPNIHPAVNHAPQAPPIQEAWKHATTIGGRKQGDHYLDTDTPYDISTVLRTLLGIRNVIPPDN